jgi:hypothetical protein
LEIRTGVRTCTDVPWADAEHTVSVKVEACADSRSTIQVPVRAGDLGDRSDG